VIKFDWLATLAVLGEHPETALFWCYFNREVALLA